MVKKKKEINIKLDLSFFTLDNIKDKIKIIKNKLQKIDFLKNRGNKGKYKTIGLLFVGIFLLIIALNHSYKQYFYYKIPQVYKKDLKVYSGVPNRIYYVNNIETNKGKPDFNKIFVYGSYGFELDKPITEKNFSIPVAAYGVINTNYSEIKKQAKKIEETKKIALKNNFNFFYDIFDKSISIRYGNYDGDESPYKSPYFKELNSRTSKKTNISIFFDGKSINDIDTGLSRSILGYGGRKMFQHIFSNKLANNIEKSYVVLDIDGDKGLLNMELYTYDTLENDRLLKLICAQIRDNYSHYTKHNSDEFAIRGLKCSTSLQGNKATVTLNFIGVKSHIRLNNN